MSKRGTLLLTFILTALICFGQDSSKDSFDVFQEFSPGSSVTSLTSANSMSSHNKAINSEWYWIGAVLLLTVLAGVFVRFKSLRSLRSLFLVGSIVVFGFYRSGCPCSIQSLQNNVLFLLNFQPRWPSLSLFLGLIPITYFFGRVYCGWICHLGALQELIYTSSSTRLFQSNKSQKIMRYLRIAALVILITQLIITRTNLYKNVDPFSVVFSFYSKYFIGWALVVIIVGTSLLLFRPFCKTLCPVGLTLGWISKIPGASVVGVKNECINCNLCTKTCNIRAITRDSKLTVIESQECIRCGQCLDSCKKNAINIFYNSRSHRSRTLVRT
ncbi:MAG: 4Fe-4S binding protein [Candidatus Dadabacteria bacterium]